MIGDWVLAQASRAAADAAVRSFEDAGRPPPPAHPIRMALGREVRRVVARLAERLPRPRVIYDRAGLSPYLSRYYVLGGARDNEDGDAETQRAPWELLNLYLHHFHRGDDDLALHNHPWSWSVSLVLAGGYREERRDDTRPRGADVVLRDVPPLSFNVIRGTDFHRVELLEDDCWSLFLAGPKVSSWGFWDRTTGETLGWREFINRRRGEHGGGT